MSKILGIDYGTKRIGVAISSEDRTLAFPHSVLDASRKPVEAIRAICSQEKIQMIVVGVPHGLQGSDTVMTRAAMHFSDDLEILGVPIERVNEFFSSKEASRGASSKDKIDAAAAAIVLQSYLERAKGMID